MNYYGYEIDEKLLSLASEGERELEKEFRHLDDLCLLSSSKILRAFQEEHLAYSDFVEMNGYGYYDGGRDKLERVFARIFNAEDALVRPQIMAGTHAINLVLTGLLKYGDTMISLSGTPYDSLQTIIGLAGDSKNTLIANGIKYEQIDLIDNDFDYEKIKSRLKNGGVKLVEIQRSRGYSTRKSLTIEKIEKVIKEIRSVNKEVIIMVDNCYGDLVEEKEPTDVGADIIAGSLMKNLGGGVAKTGGYIVGKKDLINSVAERLTAPGTAKDMGANFNEIINYFKGLFLAPRAINSALKTMVLSSFILDKLGFHVDPMPHEKRTDLVQTVDLDTEKNMIDFHIGIQQGSPVDSFVTPVPGPMPGYAHPEIMASGAFTQGSTIELSSDGPLCPPYTAFMQGSLTYEYGKLGMLIAINNFMKNKKEL